MNDDQRHEAAIAACRVAVSAWIERGDDKAGKALRDCLHALSVCRGSSRELREKPGPKRRKAA